MLRGLLLASALSVQIATLPDSVWLAAMLGTIAAIRWQLHGEQILRLDVRAVAGELAEADQQTDSHIDADDLDYRWQLQGPGQRFRGRLYDEGYQSPWLLVIVLESSAGKRLRIPVWRDSVEASAFSWLAWQLRLLHRPRRADTGA